MRHLGGPIQKEGFEQANEKWEFLTKFMKV